MAPSGGRRGIWLANAALAAVAVLVGLVIVEAGLRLYGIHPAHQRLDIYRFDDRIGWLPRPGTRIYRSEPHFAHTTHYNADGLPVAAANWRAPPDRTTPAVALVGDSFVEGYYLPYELGIAYRLDRALPHRQVVNLGVAGYSPGQYLLRARDMVPKYDVREIVVVLFPYNDVPFVEVGRFHDQAKPLFRDGPEPVNLPLEKTGHMWWQSWVNLAFVAVIEPYVRRLFPPADIRPAKQFTVRDDSFRKAMRLVARIRDEFPEKTFHVAYMPSAFEYVEPPVLARNREAYEDICAEQGLRCHFPERFVASGLPFDALYIPGDGHLTAEGARRYAAFLGGVLAKR